MRSETGSLGVRRRVLGLQDRGHCVDRRDRRAHHVQTAGIACFPASPNCVRAQPPDFVLETSGITNEVHQRFQQGESVVRRENCGEAGVDEGSPLFFRLFRKHDLPLQFLILGFGSAAISLDPSGQGRENSGVKFFWLPKREWVNRSPKKVRSQMGADGRLRMNFRPLAAIKSGTSGADPNSS